MRYGAVAALLLCVSAACSLGLEVPEGTSISCASQSDCPEDFVCQTSLSRCVPLGFDITAPALAAPPAISPMVVGSASVVTVGFATTKHLALEPEVTIVFGSTIERPAHLATSANDATEFTFTYTPDGSEPQSFASVLIVITDAVGNQATSETPLALRFDFEPPAILDGTAVLSRTPADTSVLASSDKLGIGGTATLRFQTSEPLADVSHVVVAGVDVPFVRSSVLGTVYTYTAVYAGPGGDGDHAISFIAVDDAGNNSNTPLGTLSIDTVAPPPPSVGVTDTVVYRRAPWDANPATRFTVRGAAGAFEAGATVAVFDDGQTLLESARAGSDGSLAAVGLTQLDRLRVFVRVIDDAGNGTAPALVQDVEWVGAFDPGATVSPHAAYAFDYLTPGLATNEARRVIGAELARLGDVDAAAPNWTQATLLRPWVERRPSAGPPGRYFSAAAYDARREQMVLFGGRATTDSSSVGTQTFALWNGAWNIPSAGRLPSARFGHGMAYDAQRDRVVLYGGQNGSTISDETWEWDGSRWQQLNISGPGGFTFHAMAYEPAKRRVVLFGGCYDANCSDVSNETWAFDGAAWTPVNPTTPPTPRLGHSLTDYNGNLVVFGGCPAGTSFDPATGDVDCGATYLNDFWRLVGNGWSNASDGSEPSPRAFHAAVWDGADNLFIYGGGEVDLSTADDQVWVSDGGSFFPDTATGEQATGVVGVYHAGMHRPLFFGGAYDADIDGVLIRNTLSYYVGGFEPAASTTAPVPVNVGGLAYSPRRQTVVLAGGGAIDSTPRGVSLEWHGSAWEGLANNIPDTGTTRCPDNAYGPGVMLYNSSRQQVVSLCGNRTFELGSGSWLEVCTTVGCRGTLPAGTDGYAMAYDSLRNQTLILGGGAAPATSRTLFAYNGAWTTLCAPAGCSSPPLRRCAAMAYDAARDRTVLFGGGDSYCADVFDGDSQGSPMNDTWEWSGSAWTPVCTGGGCTKPPARARALMVYDSGRARVVLVGEGYGDIWEWTGATWVQQQLFNAPQARRASMLAYDAARSKLVLYGGRDAGFTNLTDFWEWDASSEQRPAVLLDFDWNTAAVPRTSVRSVTVHARAGGRGATNDLSLGTDANTVGDPKSGVQIEEWRPDIGWYFATNTLADVASPNDITAVATTNCGGYFLNAADGHVYARVSPSFGAGNGDQPPALAVDAADVTVRYTIGQTSCP